MRKAITILSLLLGSACTSIDSVNLEEYLTGHELVMTTDNPPADASPLTVVAVHQTGFYLLGFVPFAPVRLEDCVAELVDKAQSMGADGVSNLKVDYMPAALFKFAAFPVPDWSAAISLSGMTYRMPWNAAYPAQPGPR